MLDKLYYIFHCSVKSGFAQAERASFMLSFSISIYVGALCFLIMIITKSAPSHPFLACAVFMAFGVALVYLSSWYFLSNGRYRRIIERYGSPRALNAQTRFFYRVISVGLFFIGSFVAFITTGIMLSQYLNL